MDARPFHPTAASTKKLSTSTTTNNVQLVKGGTSAGPMQFRIRNAGSVDAFIRHGSDSSVLALSDGTDMPIGSGSVEVITLTVPEATNSGIWLAGITASGTADLYITPGAGI